MRIELGILKSRIITDNPELISALSNLYAVRVPGAEYSPAYRSRGWDGKKYFITTGGVFRTGLLSNILNNLSSIGCTNPEISKYKEHEIEYQNEGLGKYKLYPYQLDLIKSSLKHKRGIVCSPTGSGKTIIIAGILKALKEKDLKTVVLFNSKQLVTQTFKFLTEECKFKDIGICYGEGFLDGKIMLSTVQSIHKILDNYLDADALLIDEVHEFSKGKIALAAIESFPNATFRLGFTATIPADRFNQYNLIGALGPILEAPSAKALVEEGFLTKPLIQMIPNKISDSERDLLADLSYSEIYDSYLVRNQQRNSMIASIVEQIYSSNEEAKIVILTKSLEHTDILHDLIKDSLVIEGKNELTERYSTINEFLKNNRKPLIGTKVLQTGVNIEEITHLIIARGLQSEIATLQALGRSLRKHKSKEIVYIYDFQDKNVPYLEGHAKARKKAYKKAGHEIQ